MVLIWGLIFYKIYSNFNGKDQKIESFQAIVPVVENEKLDSVFTLSLNYADPFLKGIEIISYSEGNEAISNTKNYFTVTWPLIEYRGLLTSRENDKSTGFLKIQGLDCLVKEGYEYASVKVIQLKTDSIFLTFQKEKRWVKLLKTINQ